MSQQPSLFKAGELKNLARQFDPVSHVAEGAASYQAEQGKTFRTGGLGDVHRDPEAGHATYLAYRDAMDASDTPASTDTPKLRESYEAMREHVGRQYEHMTKPKEQGGMGMTHEVTSSDPYETPAHMAEDVRQGRIKTFATASTGPHELFTDEENDKFRAVHDVFGHASIGRGFSRDSEEAAFQAHRQMFPAAAHAALASETRGQNSYLNYSPENTFASQEGRLVGLPSWASKKGQTPDRRSPYKGGDAPAQPAPEQGQLFDPADHPVRKSVLSDQMQTIGQKRREDDQIATSVQQQQGNWDAQYGRKRA